MYAPRLFRRTKGLAKPMGTYVLRVRCSGYVSRRLDGQKHVAERLATTRAAPIAVGLLTLVLCAAFGESQSGANASDQATLPAPGTRGGSCQSRSDCGAPLKAGLRITFTGWACTSGFLARDRANAKFYLVTAGHCLVSSGLPARWSHGAVEVGRGVKAFFGDAHATDAGTIDVSDVGPRNLVFASGPFDLRAIEAVRAERSQVIGTGVCRSGGAGGWRCGTISRADVDVTIRGHVVRHTWWTDFPSAEGDSGAPVFDKDGALAGIIVATTASESVYLSAAAVSAALGVVPCLDPECR